MFVNKLYRPVFQLSRSPTYNYFLSYSQFNKTLQTAIETRPRNIHNVAEQTAVTVYPQNSIFSYLSESYPVHLTQEFLINCHELSNVSWWATIVGTTITLRTCVTLPLALYQNYIFAKIENLTGEMPDIVKELKLETAIAMKQFKWSEKQARIVYNRSLKKQWNKLIIRENCHPFKASILLWVQLPMWIGLSAAFRNLVYMLPSNDVSAEITYVELTLGGFGWIQNLTVPDEWYILPVSLGLINLAIIELQALSRVDPASKIQRYLTNFFRLFSILMIPIATMVPSCLALYWVTSSSYGLIQNLVLLNPKFKRFFKIPQTTKELERPYQHIWNQIKK